MIVTHTFSEGTNFLKYYLISKYGQSEIKQQTVGAVQPKLAIFSTKPYSTFSAIYLSSMLNQEIKQKSLHFVQHGIRHHSIQ